MSALKAQRDKYLRDHACATLALQIRANRLCRGWTQADLAKRTGMKQEAISRLEKGTTLPNTSTLLVLARAFDVAVMAHFVAFSDLGISPFDDDHPEEPR